MTRFKVGAVIHQQHCSLDDVRAGWRAAEALGVDSLWDWDHFFTMDGDPDGLHYEGLTLLAAMAAETTRPQIGTMVTCVSYRNPDLLADMARTIDHLSHGRMILALGAGWFERDYDEYGYPFGTAMDRLERLEQDSIPRIKERLSRLNPPPVGPMPIMLGGDGKEVTLRIAAEHADIWNGFGPIGRFRERNAILDTWCERVGRDPATLERSVLIDADEAADVEAFHQAGATHIVIGIDAPFDLAPVEAALELARG
jgi:probable F420-dependent oxidoreductase, MSMEG_2906 family